jgi:hypothetical protein
MANPTFVLMQDGTYADPATLTAGKDGVLCSKTGLKAAVNEAGEPFTQADATALGKAAQVGPVNAAAPVPEAASVAKPVAKPLITPTAPAAPAAPASAAVPPVPPKA